MNVADILKGMPPELASLLEAAEGEGLAQKALRVMASIFARKELHLALAGIAAADKDATKLVKCDTDDIATVMVMSFEAGMEKAVAGLAQMDVTRVIKPSEKLILRLRELAALKNQIVIAVAAFGGEKARVFEVLSDIEESLAEVDHIAERAGA